jgi:hypothetical protein
MPGIKGALMVKASPVVDNVVTSYPLKSAGSERAPSPHTEAAHGGIARRLLRRAMLGKRPTLPTAHAYITT